MECMASNFDLEGFPQSPRGSSNQSDLRNVCHRPSDFTFQSPQLSIANTAQPSSGVGDMATLPIELDWVGASVFFS
jgi:hypothetical protein